MAYAERWWDQDTVAVVTGANKGIGFECARILSEQGLSVVLCARDDVRGQKAVNDIQQAVPDARVVFCQADITNADSIQGAADFLKTRFGRIHILINNAGMAYKGSTFGASEAAETIACNLKGTRRFTEAVLPLLDSGSRIVNVCSRSGHLRQLSSASIREGFVNPESADAIEELADSFVDAIRSGKHRQLGWSNSMYGISKVAEISYTLWLARQLADKDISVNAVCPGWCQTDMSSHSGPKTAAQGADTPVWLALQKPSPTGEFFEERRAIVW